MTFKFLRTNFNGDPNIGMYGFATDKYCFLGANVQQSLLQRVRETLKTEIVSSTVSGTELTGLFAMGNSNGIILSKIIEDYEVRKLKENGLNLKVINSNETALGNLILCNDKGCLISSSLKKFQKEISDVLDCEVEIGKIANLDIVGSCGIASNIGCLCHREAREEELKKIEEILKVKVDVGSVTYGTPYIRSGIIVNSNGVLVSNPTTGAEIGRIGEVFE
jgi:translation initiation factor 6